MQSLDWPLGWVCKYSLTCIPKMANMTAIVSIRPKKAFGINSFKSFAKDINNLSSAYSIWLSLLGGETLALGMVGVVWGPLQVEMPLYWLRQEKAAQLPLVAGCSIATSAIHPNKQP